MKANLAFRHPLRLSFGAYAQSWFLGLSLVFFGNGMDVAHASSVTRMDTQAQTSLYELLTHELGLSEREITAHLPPKLGDISRLLGLGQTLRLIDHARGKQIYLPKVVRGGDSLSNAIGYDDAVRLIGHLGSDQHVTVSNPFNARFIVRRKAINAIRQGWSLNQVCSHFGIAFTTARDLRKIAGVSPAAKTPDPRKSVVLAMAESGLGNAEIAFRAGVHIKTVVAWKKQQRESV